MCKVTSLAQSESGQRRRVSRWRISAHFHLPSAPDRHNLNRTWFSCAVFPDCGSLRSTALRHQHFLALYRPFPSNRNILHFTFRGAISSSIEWLIFHCPVTLCPPPLLSLPSLTRTPAICLRLYMIRIPIVLLSWFYPLLWWLVWRRMLVFKSTLLSMSCRDQSLYRKAFSPVYLISVSSSLLIFSIVKACRTQLLTGFPELKVVQCEMMAVAGRTVFSQTKATSVASVPPAQQWKRPAGSLTASSSVQQEQSRPFTRTLCTRTACNYQQLLLSNAGTSNTETERSLRQHVYY